jgi:hypothetical protein
MLRHCILVALATLLIGCADYSADCAWSKKISTSHEDVLTRQTENEIVAHNAKVERFCR